MQYSTARATIINERAEPHGAADAAQGLGTLPAVDNDVPGRIVQGELKAAGETDVYTFTGLSGGNPTDMLVSLTADADVLVRIDTVPTFDSESLVEITLGGKAGSAETLEMKGTTRYIAVSATPDGNKQTGKYTLGVKRLPTAN
jgi:hypothetical protein